ncbi:MAG: prolipoprotein diacylglyceryl transferase [Chloroflexi bacterium]|nr:MAG: prolipoprotein diacylglyceryl transferase [Chloroflexota bacterium]MBL1195543.1 prolipoprotein diacylglyceryl transferase [Chloroflexota bacterium]NOH12826.1 prolipoprotein diacylglyceryl transferase [Chloroflexota bacterium]
MLPILQVGPLAIQTPGLILLAGVWIGLSLAERNSQRYKIMPDTLYNLVFTMLVAGILGARLAYAARFPNAFIENPLSLISINPGLLDPFGGFLIAVVAGLIYGQRKNMLLWPTLDAVTPVIGIMLIAIPLSNLASGHAFGSPTTLPWGIRLWGAQRHPVQVYEMLAAGAVLWLMWPTRQPKEQPSGWTFLQFIVLSTALRLFFETFRGDSEVLANGIRFAQLSAWVILAIGLFTMNRISRQIKD